MHFRHLRTIGVIPSDVTAYAARARAGARNCNTLLAIDLWSRFSVASRPTTARCLWSYIQVETISDPIIKEGLEEGSRPDFYRLP